MNGHERRNKVAFAECVVAEAECLRWQSKKVALIQQVLQELNARGVLADIGCFTGAATERFRSLGYDRVVGFDMCEEALERASARGIEARYWQAGLERCPAANGEFDVIVAADIIEHIVDTDAFIEEVMRILQSNGRLIITTPNLAFWISRIRLLLGKPPWSYPGPSSTTTSDMNVDLNHIRLTTRREWETLFRSHSLEIERVMGWSILHAKGNTLGVRARRFVDTFLTRYPEYAFGLLFQLKKGIAWS